MHEQTAVVRLPLEGPIFVLVEDWRRSQPKIPSRNEAIRLLLRRALERSSENSQPTVVERDGAVKSRGVICRGSANGAGLDDPR
jgi:hypothetical protein